MLEYAILAGILFGLYFALVGLGLNLVFGVMRIVNLAHGDFLMLGALVTGAIYAAYTINPIIGAVLCLVGFVILGIPLYYALIPRLLGSHDPEMLSIILFFGLSQLLEALTIIAVGPNERTIPSRALGSAPIDLLGQTFPAAWISSAVVSALAVALVFAYLYRTRLGRQTRAVMVDRNEALATGIDVNKVSALTFGISLGLAAAAGSFAPFILGGISPASGVHITIQAFAVIIIGALGSPLGTVLGGLIYGISLMLMQTYFSSWAQLLPYVVLILILLVRPTGLLGRKVRHA